MNRGAGTVGREQFLPLRDGQSAIGAETHGQCLILSCGDVQPQTVAVPNGLAHHGSWCGGSSDCVEVELSPRGPVGEGGIIGISRRHEMVEDNLDLIGGIGGNLVCRDCD